MTLDEKLDYFYKSTIEDATKHSVSTVEEYKESLNKIYETSKENLIRKAEINYNIESKNLLRDKNKVLSNDQLELRRQLNERTDELTESLFLDVIKKVNEYRTTPDYTSTIIKQISDAKEYAKTTELIAYLSPEDEAIKSEIEQKTSTRVELETSSFLGGTKIMIPAKNVLVDNSFASKITEQKETFTI